MRSFCSSKASVRRRSRRRAARRDLQVERWGMRISYQKSVARRTSTQASRGEVISKRSEGGRSWESAQRIMRGITSHGNMVAIRRDHF